MPRASAGRTRTGHRRGGVDSLVAAGDAARRRTLMNGTVSTSDELVTPTLG